MRKSILVLLFLLTVLIIVCVYQKTYTIYSSSSNELTLIERKPVTQEKKSDNTVAAEKEKTSVLPVFLAPTLAKPVETKKTDEIKPVSEIIPAAKADEDIEIKTEEVEQAPVTEPEAKTDTTEKIKATPVTDNSVPAEKVSATQSKEPSVPEPEEIEKQKTEDTEKSKPVMQNAAEKEIVDYVMWALNNRDIALKNRDEVEARIQELIRKALDDRELALKERQAVLNERSENETALVKLQTELIDARDASYESVINPKTTNEGKK